MNINKIKRKFAKVTPSRLYSRILIIIIAPMILLQSVIAYIFMERHWQTVTESLSTSVVNDIATIIDVIESYQQDINYSKITRIAGQQMKLDIDILPDAPLPMRRNRPFFAILDYFLSKKITENIKRPFWIDTVGNSDVIEIRIKLAHNILRVFAKRSQTYASDTWIFILWMAGTALILIIIAIYFLHLQIRPIQQLAIVSEKFGKGEIILKYHPGGAVEIRKAGIAFLRMKKRIERQIQQRTMMLSGVSHDLKTILTRFRLGLSLIHNTSETKDLEQDVVDMTKMIDGYLAFVRGEIDEEKVPFNLMELVKKLQNDAKLRHCNFSYDIQCSPLVMVRPSDFSRLVTNLTSNAAKYGNNVKLSALHYSKKLIIHIDDDGIGIPANMRQQVFKPFVKLNQARNQDEAGTGLGLSIALDIARSHGGTLVLNDSPLGGLRATIKIPL